MIRIGIAGTESSHALAFARFFNTPDKDGMFPYENMRVTAIAGDEESNEKICREIGVDLVALDPVAMLGHVDALMITSRRGSSHYAIALPFVQNRIPLFVDKPFTSSVEEARQLVELISSTGVHVMGGSGCKYAPEILAEKKRVQMLRRENKILSATMGFTIMESPYDGFWFYAPHLVEMALEVFGYDVVGVSANKHKCGIIAQLMYADISVSLHFDLRLPEASCTIYTTEGSSHTRVDISAIYAAEAMHFANMLITEMQPQPTQELLVPICLIDSILKSVQNDGQYIEI